MNSACWRSAFAQDKTRFGGRGNLFSLTSFLSATQLNFCTCMIHSIFISGKTRRLCALASSLKVQLPTNSVCDGISVLKHFASFPRKVAQDGIKKMRGFYQPWLQGKLQCHRRLVIPFRIIFPILLSVADSCSLLVLRWILPVSLQLEVCLVTRRLSALLSSWRDEKTGNSLCCSQVSCPSWLSVKQKESWVLIEKNLSDSLPSQGRERKCIQELAPWWVWIAQFPGNLILYPPLDEGLCPPTDGVSFPHDPGPLHNPSLKTCFFSLYGHNYFPVKHIT